MFSLVEALKYWGQRLVMYFHVMPNVIDTEGPCITEEGSENFDVL